MQLFCGCLHVVCWWYCIFAMLTAVVLAFPADGSLLYVGRDKYENEDLIKHGWPEDVWFHVDNLSSPHVYVRMPRGQAMESLSEDAIRDAAQWCKQGSIDGCKKASVTIVYTPWSNLRKDAGMDVSDTVAAGQAGWLRAAHECKTVEACA